VKANEHVDSEQQAIEQHDKADGKAEKSLGLGNAVTT
jgi:hypothetical protein